MLQDLSAEQLQLAELMSSISEDGYSAGWMKGLEYALWEILHSSNHTYGVHHVSQQQREQLRYLSNKCGCWIVFDEDTEETAVDLDSWRGLFLSINKLP